MRAEIYLANKTDFCSICCNLKKRCLQYQTTNVHTYRVINLLAHVKHFMLYKHENYPHFCILITCFERFGFCFFLDKNLCIAL